MTKKQKIKFLEKQNINLIESLITAWKVIDELNKKIKNENISENIINNLWEKYHYNQINEKDIDFLLNSLPVVMSAWKHEAKKYWIELGYIKEQNNE